METESMRPQRSTCHLGKHTHMHIDKLLFLAYLVLKSPTAWQGLPCHSASGWRVSAAIRW